MEKNTEINLKKFNANFNGYKYSISFVGNPSNEKYLNIFCDLIKVFGRKLHIFSPKTQFLKSVEIIKEKELLDKIDLEIYSSCWNGFYQKEEDLAKVYNSSKINLHLNASKEIKKDKQIFEILAAGGFLLTKATEDLEKYFEPSKHLETFKDTYDLIDKINFYLNNLNLAQKIASLGKYEVVRDQIVLRKK